MIAVNITKEESDGGRIDIDFDKNGKVRIFTKDYPEFTLSEVEELANEIFKTVKFMREQNGESTLR